jgi:hypothetical protein
MTICVIFSVAVVGSPTPAAGGAGLAIVSGKRAVNVVAAAHVTASRGGLSKTNSRSSDPFLALISNSLCGGRATAPAVADFPESCVDSARKTKG